VFTVNVHSIGGDTVLHCGRAADAGDTMLATVCPFSHYAVTSSVCRTTDSVHGGCDGEILLAGRRWLVDIEGVAQLGPALVDAGCQFTTMTLPATSNSSPHRSVVQALCLHYHRRHLSLPPVWVRV